MLVDAVAAGGRGAWGVGCVCVGTIAGGGELERVEPAHLRVWGGVLVDSVPDGAWGRGTCRCHPGWGCGEGYLQMSSQAGRDTCRCHPMWMHGAWVRVDPSAGTSNLPVV